MLKRFNPLFIGLITIFSCTGEGQSSAQQPPSHQLFTHLLQKYVLEDGVNYAGLQQDSLALVEYLNDLSSHAPDKNSWSKEEQLAYWINAYNAFTLKLIIDNYPVESITDLHPTLYIPLVNTVWHKKFFTIGGVPSSLDYIEHEVLRKQFDEPRIHFAINCASFSCPPLRAEAFEANTINQQLEEQAQLFINDSKRNQLAENQIGISKIFSWFKGDFVKNGSIIEYLNQYSNIEIKPDAKIIFLPYNWALNDVKR